MTKAKGNGKRQREKAWEDLWERRPKDFDIIVPRHDWINWTIAELGGVAGAAKVAGVAPATIRGWLRNGFGTAKFGALVKLAKASNPMKGGLGERGVLGLFADSLSPLTRAEHALIRRRHKALEIWNQMKTEAGF